jgi:hypothetical protein
MPSDSIRSLASRAGSFESWARTADRSARTAPGRAAFLDRFEREVDPDGVLAPEERARRAEYLRKAYFTRLALKSAKSRARRARSHDEDVDLAAELRAAADQLGSGDAA